MACGHCCLVLLCIDFLWAAHVNRPMGRNNSAAICDVLIQFPRPIVTMATLPTMGND